MEKNIDLEEINNKEKVFAVRQLVRSMELKLLGYKNTNKGEKVVLTPNVLLSNDLIQKSVSLLDSFSKEANLIGVKKKFPKQQYITCMTELGLLARDLGCPPENYELVIEIF